MSKKKRAINIQSHFALVSLPELFNLPPPSTGKFSLLRFLQFIFFSLINFAFNLVPFDASVLPPPPLGMQLPMLPLLPMLPMLPTTGF